MRKQSTDTRITAEIMEEAEEPRQAASVEEALEKQNTAAVARGGRRSGTQGGKSMTAKPTVNKPRADVHKAT